MVFQLFPYYTFQPSPITIISIKSAKSGNFPPEQRKTSDTECEAAIFLLPLRRGNFRCTWVRMWTLHKQKLQVLKLLHWDPSAHSNCKQSLGSLWSDIGTTIILTLNCEGVHMCNSESIHIN